MPSRPQEERMALSRFDTVFLFSFTMIAVASSLLVTVIGPLRGLVPVMILLITIYPFYTGIWHGIMNDKLAERLFAWQYLLFQLAYLVTAFGSSILFVVLPLDALSGSPLGALLPAGLKLLVIFLIFLGTGVFALYVLDGVKRVFQENLPSAKEELSGERYRKAFKSRAAQASLFQSITVMIELFAIQEWEMTIGIVTVYPIPFSPENVPYLAFLFIFVWFFAYAYISEGR